MEGKGLIYPKIYKKDFQNLQKMFQNLQKRRFFSGWVLHLLLKLINFVTELKL